VVYNIVAICSLRGVMDGDNYSLRTYLGNLLIFATGVAVVLYLAFSSYSQPVTQPSWTEGTCASLSVDSDLYVRNYSNQDQSWQSWQRELVPSDVKLRFYTQTEDDQSLFLIRLSNGWKLVSVNRDSLNNLNQVNC